MPSTYISYTCLCVGERPPEVDPDAGSGELRGEKIYADKLWKNGKKVGYAFVGKCKGTSRQQKVVHEAITEWRKYANVSFTEYPETDQSVRVRISFEVVPDEAKRGSWAAVGDEAANEVPCVYPTVNIAWVDGGTEEELKDAKVIALHQIGHVLGMGHEFGREVKLNKEYMTKMLTGKPNHWSTDDIDRGLFQVIQQGDITNFSAVDETSIMKYYMPSTANEEKMDIHPNLELSEKDKAYMRIHYPYLVGNVKGVFENALNTLNIDEVTAGKMKKEKGDGDLDEVRLSYVKYMVQARGA